MNRRTLSRSAIVLFALACVGCQTAPGYEGKIHTPSSDSATLAKRQLVWFVVASQLRRCHGYGSARGALLSAMAATFGGIYFIRTGPRDLMQSSEGRRRVSNLMEASYKGRFGRTGNRLNCARLARAVTTTYQRQPASMKGIIVRLSASLLRTDATGRAVIARRGYNRYARRRTYIRRAARVRHGSLKPSEQQLPIGN